MVVSKNPIELTDINQELNQLWDKEQGKNTTRASLFTLIVYVSKNTKLNSSETLIKSVISKFPCRIILVIRSDDQKETYLRTSIASETVSQGEFQIFCEIIKIEVAGPLIERVAFIITPQILPDLPVYLLWRYNPAIENLILPALERIADRIIFDPESTYHLQRYAQVVSSFLNQFHCRIGDLKWSKISGWRHLFVQVFDHSDALKKLLESKVIQIFYNKKKSEYQEHTEIEAAYLQAWIATRLNWKFQAIEIKKNQIYLTYFNQGKIVTIIMIPEYLPVLAPGMITKIEIESVKNQSRYIFKHHPETRQVFIEYADQNYCDIPICMYLPEVSEGQEIIEEIFHPSVDFHYYEILQLLQSISWES
ncbi:MAG: glucose-6-phosphate dehydrogenase assembly protein OpcA [Chlamydiales bacterium]